MAKKKKTDRFVQVKVRLRPEILEQLKRAANERQWSFNAEVTKRLTDSFEFDAAMAMRDMAMAWKRKAQSLERLRLETLRSGNVEHLIQGELNEDLEGMGYYSEHYVGDEPGDLEAAIRRRRQHDVGPMIGDPLKKRDKT